MKNIFKIFLASVFIAGSLFQSCETLELEELDNPNNLTEGDPTFLLNAIQGYYRSSMAIFNDRSSDLARIDYMFGRLYLSNYSAASLNGVWGNLYSALLPDLKEIESLQAEDNDLRFHIGMSKVMQAHMMMLLVDFLGDIIPMDQATDPVNIPEPMITSDGGASTYADALVVLDEAIALLNAGASVGGVDLYYGGDASKWIKLANTLKMRAAITTGDISTFNSLVSAGNFISDTSDDAQFAYGTQVAPVNTQHPDYANDYTTSGANIYQSNWLMETMRTNNDPRIRYYFYRQVDCTPGSSCNPAGNGETLQCSLQQIPAHLNGTVSGDIWCFMEDGYWGRLHCNDEGTPPDNFTRTAVGVYPAAGKFDDDDFTGVNDVLTSVSAAGGLGAGIEPIMLASYVDFMRAEAALTQGQAGAAANHMENGLNKSIAKVQSFVSVDGDADMSFEPSAGDVAAYVAQVKADFLAASGDDQWNILAEQHFITLYGGGADAHNFYRRTGYPTTIGLCLDPNPGNYIRTFLYPSNEVSVNTNITQRLTNDAAVFWNTQPLPSTN